MAAVRTLWWMLMVLLEPWRLPESSSAGAAPRLLGVAAMCSFIYSHTKSGIVVLILQMMVNSTALIFPVIPSTGGIPTYFVFSIVYFLCVLALYFFFGPKPILPPRKNESEASVLASETEPPGLIPSTVLAQGHLSSWI